jgi:hypothetical protein
VFTLVCSALFDFLIAATSSAPGSLFEHGKTKRTEWKTRKIQFEHTPPLHYYERTGSRKGPLFRNHSLVSSTASLRFHSFLTSSHPSEGQSHPDITSSPSSPTPNELSSATRPQAQVSQPVLYQRGQPSSLVWPIFGVVPLVKEKRPRLTGISIWIPFSRAFLKPLSMSPGLHEISLPRGSKTIITSMRG